MNMVAQIGSLHERENDCAGKIVGRDVKPNSRNMYRSFSKLSRLRYNVLISLVRLYTRPYMDVGPNIKF